MVYAYSELLVQTRQWLQTAEAEGFLPAGRIQAVEGSLQTAPEQLFNQPENENGQRPLIVAFMGGTGVGKSSLLNRLAGQAVARVGVERPTSREVSLYHHRSLAIEHLPDGLPLDSVRISQHADEANRYTVWIDMPDFDSVETHNQHLVLEWLPHIDVLLYVVSPERYRDNKAWQMLQAEGAKHAWLFVMNQWDKGQAVQYDDFIQQLGRAGFGQPLVFRTSCAEPEGDEFTDLVAKLGELYGHQGIDYLTERLEGVRRKQLQQALQSLLAEISRRDFAVLQQAADDLWQRQLPILTSGLAWPLKQWAQTWAQNLGKGQDIQLWDDWAQNRLDDVLDELALQATQQSMPSHTLKAALQNVRSAAGKRIKAAAEIQGRQALLNPGGPMRRFFIRLTAAAEVLLPLAAMAVVGYQVFYGYYRSSADNAAYLGGDFALHSILLIGLSWLLPFFLHKKIQPSLEQAAFQGLQKGLNQGLHSLQAEVGTVLQQQQNRHEQLLRQLDDLVNRCASREQKAIDKQSVLGRALLP